MDEKTIAALREEFEKNFTDVLDMTRWADSEQYVFLATSDVYRGWLACYQHLEPQIAERDEQIKQLRAELGRWRSRAKDAEGYIDECGM